MPKSGSFVSRDGEDLAGELVRLFQQLGYAVVVRSPDSAEVMAASAGAESLMLAADPGLVRIAASRLGGVPVRVEILRNGESDAAPLTPRQRAVARLLAAGKRNLEIADELGISPHTVRRHLESIFRRLNVPNRTAAVAELRKGLIVPITEVDHDDES